ncbi:uncharacterized protein THITE_2106401 [Thermothielavioides terrestris NRRL 8126]|jgi:2-haloacid dehalogenase|uniref:Uncharacterized protein n=1 Tax=Thermothielavioides terrestris (strain ATCC 38088 / NRRL 8126) TaxID=578455 RepID=G2QXL7_THETT|nr:uncharacterized protein THITE_2106401 [Thermothielavioides terrestris NRRL 8126]AEO62335.1 hypothetical protein THITE_2106401 [Thermothielavioides terrestris NRRL 8126]
MSAPAPSPLASTIKALTFDIFGTAVDWRTSITDALATAAAAKLTSSSSPSSSSAALPAPVLAKLQTLTPASWALFAAQWRAAYGAFTSTFDPAAQPWKDVDGHHRESLARLLGEWGLGGLYTDGEMAELSRAWHFLRAWPDSAAGLRRLRGAGFATASLSNGNRALLRDLDAHAALGLDRLISAEDFGAYKPRPEVYRGACEALGLEPRQVAMVAAHLKDLEAARGVGMRTVYVARPGEEEWKPEEERYARAREWVDVWVAEGEGGFEELARRLGA